MTKKKTGLPFDENTIVRLDPPVRPYEINDLGAGSWVLYEGAKAWELVGHVNESQGTCGCCSKGWDCVIAYTPEPGWTDDDLHVIQKRQSS